METLGVLARLLAFAAGAALFGAPLFALYSGVAPPRLRPLLTLAGACAAMAAAAALVTTTGEMAGDPRAGLDPATLRDVIVGGGFGYSIAVRLVAGLAALTFVSIFAGGRRLWALCVLFGGLALASLAWAGHGAADEGASGLVHLTADVTHLLAAGVWLGALAAFLLLLSSPRAKAEADVVAALHGALRGFSGVGSAVVATIVATGLVNSWFLVGPNHLKGLVETTWGRLLLVKLVLFAGMLGLAAANRFRLTPALEAAIPQAPRAALAALRRSVALETALGLLVLALVAALGVQSPPAAG